AAGEQLQLDEQKYRQTVNPLDQRIAILNEAEQAAEAAAQRLLDTSPLRGAYISAADERRKLAQHVEESPRIIESNLAQAAKNEAELPAMVSGDKRIELAGMIEKNRGKAEAMKAALPDARARLAELEKMEVELLKR